MTDNVQADYERLEEIAGRFSQQSQAIAQMHQHVLSLADQLQGGWEGEGALAFFDEMDAVVLPASLRLQSALEQSQATVREIIAIMQAAEEDAAQPFRNGGAGGAAGGSPPSIPDVVETPPGTFDGRRAAYTTSGPTEVPNHDFHSGNATALRYEVEINGRKIPVFMPKDPVSGGEVHTLDEVAKGLAALPEASRALVNRVDVTPQPNPDDSYWATQYNDPNFTSYMTAGADGNISIYPLTPKMSQDYLDGTMVHETGHILSQQNWGSDENDPRWDAWKEAIASDQHATSQYASNSAGEDFSETLLMYYQVQGTPEEEVQRNLMPERFKILDELLANEGANP